MTDQRKGLPSSSSAWVDFNCQVSRRMSAKAKELGQLPVEEQRWLERGTLVHKAAEQGDASKLSEDEKRALEYVTFKADEKAEELSGSFSELKEFRFWMSDGGEDVYSGQPDRVRFYYDDNGEVEALLQEYKPGFEENWEMWSAQVQAAAACIYDETHVRKIIAQI